VGRALGRVATFLFSDAEPDFQASPAVPVADDRVEQSFTYYAFRFNVKGYERYVREAAGTLELAYAVAISDGTLMRDVVVSVTGGTDEVKRFAAYAAGLSGVRPGTPMGRG
jgi:hypothetical protein